MKRVGKLLIAAAILVMAHQAGAAPEARKAPDGVIVFEKGSNQPTEGSKTQIDQLAAQARSDPANWVTLESYADDSGSREMNLALGQQRIAGIERVMAMQGVALHRMRCINHEMDSVDQGRQPMRRVEIRIEKLGY